MGLNYILPLEMAMPLIQTGNPLMENVLEPNLLIKALPWQLAR